MKRLLLSTALLGLSAGSAFAQSHQLIKTDCLYVEGEPNDCESYTPDEIVTIGQIVGYSQQGQLSSPATVLSEEDIQNRNQTYVGELLRSQPGISINRSGPGGALTQIRMRGNEASHVLVLVDGVEVANPTASEFDLSGISASDVVRIEVLRGEQSALYGSDAVGGVINIITNASKTNKFWQASIEAGSFTTLSGQFTGVIPVGEASLSLGIGGLSTGGYDISGLDGEKDSSQSRNINIGLNNAKLVGVTLSGKYGASNLNTKFDEDIFFSGRLDDTDSTTIIDSQTARVDARFDVAGFENLMTLSGHEIETDTAGQTYNLFTTAIIPYESLSEGTRRNARWAIKKSFDDHAMTMLGETERETYEISPSFAFAPTRPENKSYAVAGDYRYSGTDFNLNASARQDFNDRFDDAFTWKLGGTYEFNFGGRVRASVGTGVKNPSLIELFGFYPESNFIGNPDLKPEQSFGYNIGYTQELMDGDLKLGADYFRSDLEDEIFSDFSSFPFLPRNRTTDSEREGVELTADWDNDGMISLYGSVTFLDADENDVQEIRRPEFLASVTATVQATDDFSITGLLDHTGSQLDTDFSTFSVVTLDAFTLAGLNAAYTVNDTITLTLRGENLLDEDYQEVVGYRSQGRGMFAGLRARFD